MKKPMVYVHDKKDAQKKTRHLHDDCWVKEPRHSETNYRPKAVYLYRSTRRR